MKIRKNFEKYGLPIIEKMGIPKSKIDEVEAKVKEMETKIKGMGLLNRLDNPFDGGGIVLATVEDVLNWGRAKSNWYLQFGLACCAIEFMALNASDYDFMRFGCIPRSSPRHADLIIISGTVSLKMAEVIKNLWEQMPEPRYCVAMGSCANAGGPFWEHGYHILKGVDKIIPVDVYIPGCPPRPEAFFDGIVKLQTKISNQAIFNKRKRIADEDAKMGLPNYNYENNNHNTYNFK